MACISVSNPIDADKDRLEDDPSYPSSLEPATPDLLAGQIPFHDLFIALVNRNLITVHIQHRFVT